MRITLFDNHDSFTWNLAHDLERLGTRSRWSVTGIGRKNVGPSPTRWFFLQAQDCQKNIRS